MTATTQIPPAAAARLRAMTDAELDAEVAECREWIAYHAPHASRDLRARVATQALEQSLGFALAVQGERQS